MHGKGGLGKVVRALGLMSGTSMDGIDVALITTDGKDHVERGPSATFPYARAFQERLRQALEDARAMRSRTERPGILAAVEQELTALHGDAVRRFLADRVLSPSHIEVVGFHGQTVLHRPPGEAGAGGPMTVQLGDGAALARMLGIPVVYDLRAADLAAGGQGAPLVPVYHRALLARIPQRPVAVVNIGGVANVTWIGEDGQLLAFDTGPGNALMDDWALMHTGKPYDEDGSAARAGTPDASALREYQRDQFFQRGVPKSLDRRAFNLEPVKGLSYEDGAATLAALTAATVAQAAAWFPRPPALWIVAGGGRRNTFLMERLAWHIEAPVAPAEAVQLDGDAIEAEAWAYLAVRSLKGLAITFPGTTGVARAMTGGVVARP
jgi:anhydro-N-acetylmuramic acid kinase